MTEAFFEVDSRFPVPRFTEGTEAAKPNVFGVGLTVTTFLPTPSLPASGLPVLPVHPPTTAPALFPPQVSAFLPSPAARWSQANGGPQVDRLTECSSLSPTPCHASLLVLPSLTLETCLLKREASGSSQQISELPENHKEDL